MIRVLEFADLINRFDFIDTIVQHANTDEFLVDVCVRIGESNVAKPIFSDRTRFCVLDGTRRRDIPRTAVRLARLLKEWEIDLLHAHHYEQAVIGCLATRFTPKTKLIVGRHYSDLVQILPGLKRPFYLGIEQIVNKRADRIIVPSTFISDILTKTQNISGERIDVIPYGFEAEKTSSLTSQQIDSVRQELISEGSFVITAVGKITEQKGSCYMADAVVLLKDKIPNIRMIFIGEGAATNTVRSIAEKAGMQDKFVMTGWRADAMAIMANADVVVQPSLSEAFSQVMGEAMYLSKPLVITEVSGAIDIISNGKNGFLVPKANSQALADAIYKLYSDPEARDRIAAEGRRYVEEELSVERAIKLYENSYRKTMES